MVFRDLNCLDDRGLQGFLILSPPRKFLATSFKSQSTRFPDFTANEKMKENSHSFVHKNWAQFAFIFSTNYLYH